MTPQEETLPVTNIAAYRFARLKDLKTLRASLLEWCRRHDLKGTILLSTEGINLFVAGAGADIDALVSRLREIPGLEDLTPKYSGSEEQPFTRMLVRIKKEIIAFGVEGIDPATRTSPKLPPATLKSWLDEGRPLVLLDTRNDYEVKLGTFRGAATLGLTHFRDFPKAVAGLPEDWKTAPVVMFCTGGIRCEKAGPYMEREGFEKIYQLDGGILKYFEECGGDHYDGECFVFDQRVGVDPALRESSSAQCYACQAPLTEDEQADTRYVPGRSCPHCYRDPGELSRAACAARETDFLRVADPLPGSVPYENLRPVSVPAAHDRSTLLDFLCGIFSHISRDEWLAVIHDGSMVDVAGNALAEDAIVRAGQRVYRKQPQGAEPDVNPAVGVLHEDAALVVLNKPAPLPVHPGGRFNRNTLQFFVDRVYHPGRPRPAHRLDANTTGVLVCARARRFARDLQVQFERGEVQKTYLARIAGQPAEDRFVCDAPISPEPGELGSREVAPDGGLSARTEFRILERHPDGTSLVEVVPLTGRTNQIRLHLAHLGHPIAGDPAYRSGGQLGTAMTLAPDDPPMCLHAWRISLRHPVTRETMTFEAPPPAWCGTFFPRGMQAIA